MICPFTGLSIEVLLFTLILRISQLQTATDYVGIRSRREHLVPTYDILLHLLLLNFFSKYSFIGRCQCDVIDNSVGVYFLGPLVSIVADLLALMLTRL